MVDIVMATYNGEKYLSEQLDSIFHQTYQDFRLIIRDDGSSDNTLQVLNKYVQMHPDKVIIVKDSIDCGSSKKNFMQALKSSTAEYTMFSDQDDFWLPEKIELTLKKMIEIESLTGSNRPILVFGSYRAVDETLNDINGKLGDSQVSKYNLSFSSLLVQNYVNGCLMMINKTLREMMGEYDDAILMHDWWAALLASGGGVIEHINEEMMLYRQHVNNVVGCVNVKSIKYRFRKLIDPKTKEASTYYYKQALLLRERNSQDLSEENLVVLDYFLELYKKNKIIRMYRLIKGKYLKSDFTRVIGQLWYI